MSTTRQPQLTPTTSRPCAFCGRSGPGQENEEQSRLIADLDRRLEPIYRALDMPKREKPAFRLAAVADGSFAICSQCADLCLTIVEGDEATWAGESSSKYKGVCVLCEGSAAEAKSLLAGPRDNLCDVCVRHAAAVLEVPFRPW